MEGSLRAERFRWVSFEEDPTDHGFITHHRDEPLPIARTAQNYHFFHWNGESAQFELNYTGSAEVVHLLDLHLAADERLRAAGKPPRPISYYDKSGGFYDAVIVLDVNDVEKNKVFGPKHIAVFQTADGSSKPFAEAIDAIYCLGLPLAPDQAPAVE
ncbi:MAG TPA: hypothetical protein VHC21_01260 [Candidatus Saccharimonadales bacterium]|nr:hypothetical protein [Candidatus Saccharimonadales bacterium]